MSNKKKILISWANSYIFYETMLPLIPRLAKYFDVYVVLLDCLLATKVINSLNHLSQDNVISDFWIVPDVRKPLLHHIYLKRKSKLWQQFQFDIFLSVTGHAVFEQFILRCVLPRHCLKVCFSSALGRLLLNSNSASAADKKTILARSAAGKAVLKYRGGIISWSFLKKALRYLALKLNFIGLYRNLSEEFKVNYLSRYFIPILLVQKAFVLSSLEYVLQTNINDMDAYIFCDEDEAREFSVKVSHIPTYVSEYPTQNNCRCNGHNYESAVLFPLTVYGTRNELTKEQLIPLYNNIKLALAETGAKAVHFRLHPRCKGPWFDNLLVFLKKRGIEASSVSNDLAIREIMCNYLGMAGYASTSLRDGRAACDHAFVVGFTDISQDLSADPKAWFGKSEGISWVGEDGSYDPKIFQRRKYIPPERKSLEEILQELLEQKKKMGVEHAAAS